MELNAPHPDGALVHQEIVEHMKLHGGPVSEEKSRELAYNSLFGRGRLRISQRALPSSWAHKQLVKPEFSSWDLSISPKHLLHLLNGCIPENMGDKLFIYADGPDVSGHAVIHFHNSWVQVEIAQLSLIVSNNDDTTDTSPMLSATVNKIAWETDARTPISTPNLAMAKFFVLQACHRVLGIDLVDEIEEPPEWPGLSWIEGPVASSTSQGPTTLYAGGTMSKSYLEEIQSIFSQGLRPSLEPE